MDTTNQLVDTNQLVEALLTAASNKQWFLLFSAALIGLTWLVRWSGPKFHDKWGALVTSDRGGQVVALVNGVGLTLLAAAKSGKPFTAQLLVGAIMAGLLGGGTYNAVKNLVRPSDKKKPQEPATAPKIDTPRAAQGGFAVNSVYMWALLVGVAALGIGLMGFLASGCATIQEAQKYCADPSHAGEAKCVADEISVDCGISSLEKATGDFFSGLFGAISTSKIDWAAIGEREKNDGIATVACGILRLQKATNVGAPPSESPKGVPAALVAAVLAKRDIVHVNAEEYFAARRIKFKSSSSSLAPEDALLAQICE